VVNAERAGEERERESVDVGEPSRFWERPRRRSGL
jgi:hypothetical protein